MAKTAKGGKTAAKKSSSSKAKNKNQVKQQESETGFMRGEVLLIASFALAVLLFLSNFHLCGVAGDYLRKMQLGIFGMMGFLVPIFLFVGTCFAMSNQGNPIAALKMAAAVAGMLILCGLAEMVFGGGYKAGQKILDAYVRSSENGLGGGLVGGVLAQGLGTVLGVVGTYLVLLVVFAICCVCVTERSLVALVKRGGGRAYQYAKEDARRRREIHEERREERLRLREEEERRRQEQRVRGVNLDATKLGGYEDQYPEEYGQDPEDGYDDSGFEDDGYYDDGYDGRQMDDDRGYDGEGCDEEYDDRDQEIRTRRGPVRKGVPRTASGDMPEEHREDVFTGQISLPPQYIEEDEDSPFDEEDVMAVQDALRTVWQDVADEAVSEEEWDTLDAQGAYAAEDGLRGQTGDGDQRENGSIAGRATEYSRYGGHAGGGRNEEAFLAKPLKEPRPDDQSVYGQEEQPYGPQGYGAEPGRSSGESCGTETGQGYGRGYEPESGQGYGQGYAPGQGRHHAVSQNPDQDQRQEYRTDHGRDYGDDPMPESITHWVPELKEERILRVPKAGADERIGGGGSVFDRELSSFGREDTSSQDEDFEDPEDFRIPEESKRVVTASGKIIESDTEELKKKVESRRKEVREEHGDDALGVAAQIKEREMVKKEYQFPPVTLLKRGSKPAGAFSEQEYKDTAIKLQQTLKNFGVGVTVTNISCGPSVTRYELRPEQGVKVSKIVGLADDIKLSLAAADIRIEAPIPGRSAVGIEVPNKENITVYLREIFESEDFKKASSSLSFAVGKDIGGQVVVTDIAKMPHLLIAGATGSGKSVCINTLIMSIIFKASPDDVKMIMVDPKVVELSAYNGIPHLLIPVVTDPKKASGALNWAVAEMMSRYDKFAKYNVRNLKGYNAKIETIKDIEDEDKPEKMPQIVIIIDELADLMMVSPGEVEDAICRLAQLARAAGIHLVIATQRPSVNVITGLIKANVPSRIAFAVSSGVDSRTIIDMYGAEKLLGKGDMLFYPSGVPKPQRVQGAFVSDQEVADVVEFLAAQGMETQYQPDIESKMAAPALGGGGDARGNNGRDEYFEQAGKFIIEKDKASIGMLQRMYKIGFNRAARIMDQLAEFGVVGEEEGTKPRKVLMTVEEFENLLSQE